MQTMPPNFNNPSRDSLCFLRESSLVTYLRSTNLGTAEDFSSYLNVYKSVEKKASFFLPLAIPVYTYPKWK